jgi:hypothetical protein
MKDLLTMTNHLCSIENDSVKNLPVALGFKVLEELVDVVVEVVGIRQHLETK